MKKSKRNYGDFWWCEKCKFECEGSEAIIAHLKTVHGFDDESIKRPWENLQSAHMDGKDFFSWVYVMKLNDVILRRETVSKRAKDDMMRFA